MKDGRQDRLNLLRPQRTSSDGIESSKDSKKWMMALNAKEPSYASHLMINSSDDLP